MQNGRDEGFFMRNGQKSPVHCIKLNPKHSGMITEFHYHRYIEILYAIDCCAKIWIDGKTFDFKDGDLCIINPMEMHYVSSERCENLYYVIKFLPEVLTYDGQMIPEMLYLLPVMGEGRSLSTVITNSESDKKTEDIIDEIYSEWSEEKNGYEFSVRGNILRLFCKIIRILEGNRGEIIFENQSFLAARIHTAANYTREHYDTVTAKEASEFVSMSYSYFSRSFKKIMRQSFSDFLNDVKLDAAKKLLITTGLSITEVSFESGFSSTSHFISNFKNKYNTTPLAYRKTFGR